MNEEIIKQLADDIAGKIDEIGVLPDGSSFAIMSMPLPKDHWIYETDEYGYIGEPPMPQRMGYAIKASTSCGKNMDFDPDAMCQNLIIGMLGYWTPNGL